MSRITLALFLVFTSSFAIADTGAVIRGGLEGLAKVISEQADRQRELDRQKELLRYQHELEMRRINALQLQEERRQRELREAEQKRIVAVEEARKKQAAIDKANSYNTGTGFFITRSGYLVTNAHVVGDYDSLLVRDQRGTNYPAILLAKDTHRDLALLKVDGRFPALRIEKSSRPIKGQRVMTVGYPQISIQGSESKVTDGIISSLSGIKNNNDWFQISVPIQGGNSGGALINESGSVIGIVVATVNAEKFRAITGNLPQNVNYAIKAKVLLDFLAEQGVAVEFTGNAKMPIESVDAATVLVIARRDGTISSAKSDSGESSLSSEKQTQIATLTRMHPDFRQIISDPGFIAWKNSLPSPRREVLASTWDVDLAAQAITDYKAFRRQSLSVR